MAARIRITVIAPEGAQVDAAGMRRAFLAMVRDTSAEGQRFIARYPAQRMTKSGYKRTGTLKRSWSSLVRQSSRRIEGTVGSNSNIAGYNRFVQGSKSPKEGAGQVPAFGQAGWQGVDDLEKVLQDRVNREADEIIGRFTR